MLQDDPVAVGEARPADDPPWTDDDRREAQLAACVLWPLIAPLYVVVALTVPSFLNPVVLSEFTQTTGRKLTEVLVPLVVILPAIPAVYSGSVALRFALGGARLGKSLGVWACLAISLAELGLGVRLVTPRAGDGSRPVAPISRMVKMI